MSKVFHFTCTRANSCYISKTGERIDFIGPNAYVEKEKLAMELREEIAAGCSDFEFIGEKDSTELDPLWSLREQIRKELITEGVLADSTTSNAPPKAASSADVKELLAGVSKKN